MTTYLSGLDEFAKCFSAKKNQCAVYLAVIENMPMLTLAFGYRAADEIVENLKKQIAEDLWGRAELFRIQPDQIAMIVNDLNPENLIRLDNEFRKIVRSFGKGGKQNAHLSVLTSYATAIGLEPEKILEKIYAGALQSARFSDLFSEGGLKQKESLLEMRLAGDIEDALSKNKFRLAMQPIIEAHTGKTAYHECLLRIVNEQGERQSAGMLIPIAERMGLIDDVDVLVLEMVLEKLKQNPKMQVSFNLSNVTIGNPNWARTFFESVTPDLAERMVLEITETAANRNLRETAYFIATLQEAGCQVAIDDFGSGYTSFRQVKALSADIIKIDGSLIHDIVTNQHNRALVKSLVEYLHGINTKTVAEHVDSGEKAKILMEMGIDYMQGNYFGAAA